MEAAFKLVCGSPSLKNMTHSLVTAQAHPLFMGNASRVWVHEAAQIEGRTETPQWRDDTNRYRKRQKTASAKIVRPKTVQTFSWP